MPKDDFMMSEKSPKFPAFKKLGLWAAGTLCLVMTLWTSSHLPDPCPAYEMFRALTLAGMTLFILKGYFKA